MLDAPLAGQLPESMLERWRAFHALPVTTPRQLLAHTAGLPDYFHDAAFAARLRAEPDRRWEPIELVDAAARGTPTFAPGRGFAYSDTGYVIAGVLVEEVTGQPLHDAYRALVLDPLEMHTTWLEGQEPPLVGEIAHHYANGVDMATISPTIDWAGGGLVTTARDLARFVRGLWSEAVIDARGLAELTRWTPGASFPRGHVVRYDRYGLGLGAIELDGVELVGHTGYIGAFAFHAPEYEAVLVGTHNAAEVDRWPLVAALCRELRGD